MTEEGRERIAQAFGVTVVIVLVALVLALAVKLAGEERDARPLAAPAPRPVVTPTHCEALGGKLARVTTEKGATAAWCMIPVEPWQP